MATAVRKNAELDLTKGSIMGKLALYAIPFIFSNILQILFNAADIAVLGIFIPDKNLANDAVAAVGANTSMTNLIVNVFIAFSVGASVVLGKYVGARDLEGARKTVGTSIVVALISGIILTIIGVSLAEVFLTVTNCDAAIIDMAATYLRIYFLGMPITMLYNFCASILRAVGDTQRPLIFLAIGGVVNILLNIFFVTVCNMTVEGVAIATVASQAISAALSLIVLFKSDGYGSLKMKHLKIYKEQFKEIFKIAVPSAIQSIAFNISNVLFQSKVNSLEKMTTAANAAAAQFDGVVYNVGHAVALSCMAFVSQNVGAKRMDRVKTCIIDSLILCVGLTLFVGALFLLLGEWLCGFIVSGEEIINLAVTRLSIIGMFQFLCASMDVLSFSVRALGRPNVSMVVSIVGAVIIRIIALEVLCLIFPGSYSAMLFAYPICWSLTIVMYIFILPKVYKKVKLKTATSNIEQNA